jgi:hypothetical protein
MSYEIKYHGDKRKALNDVVRWFGLRKSILIIKLIKGGGSFEGIHFAVSFGGVSGYPVRCMIERYHQRVVRRFGKQK